MVEISGRTIHVAPAVAGSVAGTVVFGLLMTMVDMTGMVAALVGSDSILDGWLVHLVIGMGFGVGFAVLAPFVRLSGWATGLSYSWAVWVPGPLVVMPLWLGMPAMVFNLSRTAPWYSLIGHMAWGVIMGLVYARLGFGSLTAPNRTHPAA